MREEWSGGETDDEPFKVRVIGGSTSYQRLGVVCEAFSGYAATQPAVEWCTAVAHLPQTQQHSIRLLGETVAYALAHEWCARMTHFFQQWLAIRAGQRAVYTLDGYTQTSSFQELVSLCSDDAEVNRRIRRLQQLMPAPAH